MTERNLILVGAPPGCGKTFVAQWLAGALKPSVFLDLDMLNPLSAQICAAAGKPYDKGGAFFRTYGREPEYETLLDIAFANLPYAHTVVVSAPFTKEFREPERLAALRARAAEQGAALHPVWVLSDRETCCANMRKRQASRDSFKLADFDGYMNSICFAPPEQAEGLTVLDNRTAARGELTAALTELADRISG